ncbi:DUF6282 family protein [Chelativorans sp. AA-79]|uniref:DUF6282 family protein n=1 Tax=Chelativorans sp. AA-79 TaxID=3028735 RepID=UPI0023F8EF79|nr:DUF6282 family protein [Chelativorans sp. AA-79]WEX08091.1 DUF6282 family protein [Chelativorans sp. AA-79]
MPEFEAPPRPAFNPEVEKLLEGAVDLHCHSGPAAMPRILDHHDQMMEAGEARFKAVVFKDHYYLGTPHSILLEKLFPETGVRLFSGIVLNNASGGINPFAVDHAVRLGGKIVWMPTFSAANHISKVATEAKGFPKVAGAPDPIPLSVLDANGKVTDETKHVLDIIAAGDIILAGGHLGVDEQIPMFEEARARGVKKMLVNHPTYLIGCEDAHIRQLVGLGVMMEHSITQFIEGRGKKHDPEFAVHLIEVAGVENTIFSSDLGLKGAARPVDGYRMLIADLLRLNMAEDDIRTMFGRNGARLLNLD